jgi:hypothetical protein
VPVAGPENRAVITVSDRKFPAAPPPARAERRFRALASGWLAVALITPIVRFCARTVRIQSLIGEDLMEGLLDCQAST